MSDAVLPAYPGFRLDVEKTPTWSTKFARAVSARERRTSLRVYPIYELEFSVEVLRDVPGTDEAKNLLGFFNLRAGGFDSFRYADPDDYAVTDQQFGIRDGATTQFQLVRAYGGFVEPVQNVNVLTNIKSDNVALATPADYTISSTGLVTLAAAGTAGHVLTWTGTYHWRVRFQEDRLPFKKMFVSLWELKKLPLIGSVMNKV